jgi:hypothetical protein
MKLIKPENELVYFTQRNNFWNPSGACFPTCMAMAIRNNGIPDKFKDLIIDDVIAMLCNTPSVGGERAKELKIKDKNLNIYWPIEEYVGNWFLGILSGKTGHTFAGYVSLNLSEIKSDIDAGHGIVLSIFMRLKKTNIKTGGHIIFCVGYSDTGLIFLDPYGNWNTWYSDTNGKLIEISYKNCETFLKPGDKPRTIRAMFVDSKF